MGDEAPQPSVPTERTWHHPGGDAGGAAPSKRGKIVPLLAVMAALAGIIVGLLFWINGFSPPFFLAITVTEYEPPFPPIPFANQDKEALLQPFPNRREAFESQEAADRLSKELHELEERKENAVVVYLCAYGLCRDNDVYIVPARTDPDAPALKLPLRQVLSLVGKCPAKHKLLILDIMRPLAEPRLGILSNPVAERTQAILKERADDLSFFVLCACSGGQVSLVSQELGTSAFGYYLGAGLSGQADGWNPRGERDQLVSVEELAAFVAYRVDRWADQNRACGQTPVLFAGKAKDFPLVVAGTSAEANRQSETEPKHELSPATPGNSSPPAAEAASKTAAKSAAKPTFRTKLEEAWTVRDQWWNDKLYRVAPRTFRQLEGALVRAEQRRRAGIPMARIQEDVTSALQTAQTTQKQLEQARLTGSTGKLRFPALAAQNLPLDAATDRALRNQDSKSIEEAKKKLVESFKDKPPVQLAWTIFSVAADDLNLSPNKIDQLLDLINSIPGGLGPLPAEIDFLRRLRKVKADEEGKWPTEAAHHALRVAVERGQALNVDARVWPWVRQALQAAEEKRLEGEKMLLEGGSEQAAQAASILENTEAGYRTINASIQVLVRAQSIYDEAWAALPGFAPYLVDRSDLDPLDLTNWQKTVQSAQKLGALFERRLQEPVSSPADLRTEIEKLSKRVELLREPLRDLERSLRELERPFRPESLRDLQERAKNDGVREYLEMEALLESPRLTAPERHDLEEARRLLGRRLVDKTRERDEKDNQDQARKMPVVNSAPRADLSADERARRRALFAIDLLQLAGVAAARDLNKIPNEKPQELGDKLRDIWARQLPQQFEELKQAKPQALPQALRQADRLSRVFQPFDRYPGENSQEFNNPAAQLLQQQTREFQKWLNASQP